MGSVTLQPLHITEDLQTQLGVVVWRGPWKGAYFDAHEVFGWATVVVHRDGWTYTTRVEPAIECCNAIVPVKWHLDQCHKEDEAHIPHAWEFKIKRGEES